MQETSFVLGAYSRDQSSASPTPAATTAAAAAAAAATTTTTAAAVAAARIHHLCTKELKEIVRETLLVQNLK